MIINNVLINGIEYGWANITCIIAGVPVTGIRAIEYSDKQEKVNVYGAGRMPVARAKGRITFDAAITLLKSEVVALQQRVSNGRLQDIAPFSIIIGYLSGDGRYAQTTLHDVEFTEVNVDVKEGDMSIEIKLPLIPSNITFS